MAKKVNAFYNPDIKQEYLDSIQGSSTKYGENSYKTVISTAKRLFNLSAPVEEMKQKDLSSFTREEILDFYSYLSIGSVSTLTNLNTALVGYCNFANKGNQAVYGIRVKELKERVNVHVVNNSIVTSNDIWEAIDTARKMKGKLFCANTVMILPAVFEGIGGLGIEEFFSIKRDDIFEMDGRHYVKLCTGRTLLISERLYELFAETMEERGYFTAFKNTVRYLEFGVSEYLFKRKKTKSIVDENPKKKAANAIKFMNAACNLCDIPFISVKMMLMSGFIEYFTSECNYAGIDAKAVVNKKAGENYTKKEKDILTMCANRYFHSNIYRVKLMAQVYF